MKGQSASEKWVELCGWGERVRQEGSDEAGSSDESYGDKCFWALLKGLNFIPQNPRIP